MDESLLKDRLALAMAGPPPVSQAALARACGIKQPSVSDWLSGRTKRLEGANLLAAARLLNVAPDWLSTGRGSMRPAVGLSQLGRPDPAILAQTQEFLETAYAFQGKTFEMARDADLFADAYEWLAEDDRPVDGRNLVDFGRWMAGRHQQEKGANDEQEQRATGQIAGEDRRRAG